jgi:two-component system sensor histidine kinase HydH
MRDVAATGDLTRKVALRSGRWDDEDARLLAASFNTLTDSIARFQREAGQKDRLLSLGRLSTVIAHEIRNPLMIIKAALRTLRDQNDADAERREAIHDIEGEADRLNRIVSDVLDFAKPIQFDITDVDLNAVCRDSVAAAWAGGSDSEAELALDTTLPLLRLDPERLRTALVNVLMNARHAVEGAGVRGPAVTVTTQRAGDAAVIAIVDRGPGIAPEDMPHIFDPYFTTRRAGTGLGLPITRTIIDGLGGRIGVTSAPGGGACIRIEFLLQGQP